MIGILRVVMLAAGVVGGTMYFLKNILDTNQWRKGINQGDLDLLKESLTDQNQSLVDLDVEELKLLSLNKTVGKVRKGGKKIHTGVFFSIYNEALVNYAFLEFDKYRKLIHVATADQDFIYRVGPRTTDIYCNENYVGFLDSKGNLISPVAKKVLITIENKEDLKYQRIEKNNKELAAILNPLLVDNPNQRVVQYQELENTSDRIMALSLLFLNMIERT